MKFYTPLRCLKKTFILQKILTVIILITAFLRISLTGYTQ